MSLATILHRRALALCVAGSVLLIPACGDDSEPDAPEPSDDTTATAGEGIELGPDAVIEYRFTDSSVPPEYHRSYTLTVTPDEVHAVVDVYDDVIGETTEALPSEVWDGLVDAADEMAAVEPSDADTSGCAGGTGRDLQITNNDETVVLLDLYLCRDEDRNMVNEEQADEIDAYIRPVIDSIPDWDTLVDRA